MIHIGIDPGQSGGIAVIDEDNADAKKVVAYPMPATRGDLIELLIYPLDARAIVEKVHAMPKQGVSSCFKFGMNYERVCMALVCNGISFREVSPQRWQRELGIPFKKKSETKHQHKNRLKAVAQELFPSAKVTLAIADALLLAEYCRRSY